MKILFIGNFSIDYCTEVHHAKTYEKLGHEVIRLQENKTNLKEILDKITTEKPEILVHTHTHGWCIDGIETAYKVARKLDIKTLGYHLDLWKGIKREIDLANDPYWNIEYFFTVDPNFISDLKDRGIKACYLPAGVFEDECYLAEPNKRKYPHDIVFVGSKNYHPEWSYRPKLINWLQSTYGSRFGHYGGDGLGVVRGRDLNELYASAKIVIGDTLCKGFNYLGYFSDRVFETTGRGGFIIHPYIGGIEKHFELSKEIGFYEFNDFDSNVGLKATIDYYLENEKTREEVRINGFNRTKKDHTYANRLKYILETIK